MELGMTKLLQLAAASQKARRNFTRCFWLLKNKLLQHLKDASSPIAIGMVGQDALLSFPPPLSGTIGIMQITLPHFYGLIQVVKA